MWEAPQWVPIPKDRSQSGHYKTTLNLRTWNLERGQLNN